MGLKSSIPLPNTCSQVGVFVSQVMASAFIRRLSAEAPFLIRPAGFSEWGKPSGTRSSCGYKSFEALSEFLINWS